MPCGSSSTSTPRGCLASPCATPSSISTNPNGSITSGFDPASTPATPYPLRHDRRPAFSPCFSIAIGWHDEHVQHFDLCIIGSGSANTIPGRRLADLQIAMVEGGTFGGICLNVGCIPSKMLVYPADLARIPAQAARLGVDLELRRTRWPDIRDRIFGRIDAKSASGQKFREDDPSITLFREPAHFVATRTLDVGSSDRITADRFVIGAGSRAVIPDLDGLSDVDYHTSDTVMRIAELPESMIILGGGYVAAEFAHIFSALGTQVTVINRSAALLRKEDRDVS